MSTVDVAIYDTTLRDGTQREGISLAVSDKLRIARELDALGVAFVEGGWPGSNPKDAELFRRAKDVEWTHAVLAAFGSTRRAGIAPEDDANLTAQYQFSAKGMVSLTLDNLLYTKPQDNGGGIWPYYWPHLQNSGALGRAAFLSLHYSFN